MNDRPTLEPHPASTAPTVRYTGPDQAVAALNTARRATHEAQSLARIAVELEADDRARFHEMLAAEMTLLLRPDADGVWWMWDGETWEIVRASVARHGGTSLLEFFGSDDVLEFADLGADVRFTPAYTFHPPALPKPAP